MLRIVSQSLPPVTKLRRMNAQIFCGPGVRHPRSLTSFTASSLNSRVNFRLSMTHLLLHKTPNLVSSEPGAAQTMHTGSRSLIVAGEHRFNRSWHVRNVKGEFGHGPEAIGWQLVCRTRSVPRA